MSATTRPKVTKRLSNVDAAITSSVDVETATALLVEPSKEAPAANPKVPSKIDPSLPLLLRKTRSQRPRRPITPPTKVTTTISPRDSAVESPVITTVVRRAPMIRTVPRNLPASIKITRRRIRMRRTLLATKFPTSRSFQAVTPKETAKIRITIRKAVLLKAINKIDASPDPQETPSTTMIKTTSNTEVANNLVVTTTTREEKAVQNISAETSRETTITSVIIRNPDPHVSSVNPVSLVSPARTATTTMHTAQPPTQEVTMMSVPSAATVETVATVATAVVKVVNVAANADTETIIATTTAMRVASVVETATTTSSPPVVVATETTLTSPASPCTVSSKLIKPEC